MKKKTVLLYRVQSQVSIIGITFALFFLNACAGKYVINTYPSGAKIFKKDIQTKDRKLIGLSPIQLDEESRLGDVFFLEIEKENYQNKSIMLKVNPGESLSVAARLDPMQSDKSGEEKLGGKGDEKKDQPQQPNQKPEEKKKDWQQEIDDLKLRVALLENTTSIQKDALFSARFKGGPAVGDRDNNERMISNLFDTQQAILKGNYQKATELIDKVLLNDEYSSHAWLLKGSIAYLQRDYPSARNAWEKSLKIDPYNKPAYQYLSETYKRLGLKELPPKGPEIRSPASEVEIKLRNGVK